MRIGGAGVKSGKIFYCILFLAGSYAFIVLMNFAIYFPRCNSLLTKSGDYEYDSHFHACARLHGTLM